METKLSDNVPGKFLWKQNFLATFPGRHQRSPTSPERPVKVPAQRFFKSFWGRRENSTHCRPQDVFTQRLQNDNKTFQGRCRDVILLAGYDAVAGVVLTRWSCGNRCVSARLWGMVPNTAGIFPQTIYFPKVWRARAWASVIRRRNSNAVLLFSSVLPRFKKFAKYKPYASGLNFALEKMCAKSQGGCIYVPSYRNFLRGGRPREEIFARHGLHLNGAGVDCLEACFQQALSTVYLTDKVTAARMRWMAKLGYWGDYSGLALRVWPLVRVEIVGLEFPVKWVFWLPCGAREPAWCKKGRVPPLGLFFWVCQGGWVSSGAAKTSVSLRTQGITWFFFFVNKHCQYHKLHVVAWVIVFILGVSEYACLVCNLKWLRKPIRQTPYAVLPLFDTRFAVCTEGVWVPFMQPGLL